MQKMGQIEVFDIRWLSQFISMVLIQISDISCHIESFYENDMENVHCSEWAIVLDTKVLSWRIQNEFGKIEVGKFKYKM